jgi:hypothetical protein
MRQPKIRNRIQIVVSLVALILPYRVAAAQSAPTASLAEQLRAQYKVAKISQQDNAAKILQPGTVLVIQKAGILTVPYASTTVCSAMYQDGKVDSPDALCPETARQNSRPFKVGERVYPAQIDVDMKKDKISFRILACDSCNGTSPATSSKSEVIFQFASGYLEKASVLEVEDTIGDILAIDNSSALQEMQPPPSQPEDSDPNVLTNDKIAKMANAKLGDAVILGKIKTSQCNFDTSTDALIKLKQAGVSDTVLQAMIEAGASTSASTSAPEQPLTSGPAQPTFSVRHRHVSVLGPGSDAIYYCSGDLSVSADGTLRYDCAQTDDPSGRCEHVSIPAGYLKQAKVGYNGLHLASKGQGSFDFIADPGTINEALKAIAPLVGIAPPASIGTTAPPLPAASSSCGDYESCMKKGEASLEQPEGAAEALTEFEKASRLDPSKSEPLTGKGYAYLQMAEYDHAAYMWDSALKLGATLSISVCHAGVACGDTGYFLLSTKEVSFVNKKGQKQFAAAPSAVTSEVGSPKVLLGNGQIVGYFVELKLSGKNYRFYYGPKGLQCKGNFMCSEPGLTQQKVVAEYVHNTLERLRVGSLVSP